MKSAVQYFVVLLSLAACLNSIAVPVAIVNGDFSSPFINGDFQTITAPAGSFIVPQNFGWRVYGSIDLINHYWNGPDGANDQSVDMLGNWSAGAIEQDVVLVAGSYRVDFMLSGNPDRQGEKILEVSLSQDVERFSYEVTSQSRNNMHWISAFATFDITTPGTYALRFAGLNGTGYANDTYGPALDKVSMNQVPETLSHFSVTALWLTLLFGGVYYQKREVS